MNNPMSPVPPTNNICTQWPVLDPPPQSVAGVCALESIKELNQRAPIYHDASVHKHALWRTLTHRRTSSAYIHAMWIGTSAAERGRNQWDNDVERWAMLCLSGLEEDIHQQNTLSCRLCLPDAGVISQHQQITPSVRSRAWDVLEGLLAISDNPPFLEQQNFERMIGVALSNVLDLVLTTPPHADAICSDIHNGHLSFAHMQKCVVSMMRMGKINALEQWLSNAMHDWHKQCLAEDPVVVGLMGKVWGFSNKQMLQPWMMHAPAALRRMNDQLAHATTQALSSSAPSDWRAANKGLRILREMLPYVSDAAVVQVYRAHTQATQNPLWDTTDLMDFPSNALCVCRALELRAEVSMHTPFVAPSAPKKM